LLNRKIFSKRHLGAPVGADLRVRPDHVPGGFADSPFLATKSPKHKNSQNSIAFKNHCFVKFCASVAN